MDVLQDFAEAMHVTQFRHDDEGFTYYEMCEKQYLPGTETTRLINRKHPIRVIASAEFDTSDPNVKALELEAASTYSGDRFVCVDVGGVGSDGLEYQTRIVAAQVSNGWYARQVRGQIHFLVLGFPLALAKDSMAVLGRNVCCDLAIAERARSIVRKKN